MTDIQTAEGNQGNAGFSDEWQRLAREDEGLAPATPEDEARHERDLADKPAAGQEEAPPVVEAADTPAPIENTDDIWANAPDALRQAYLAEKTQREKAENAVRSNNGRLSKAEREAAELRARIAARQDPAPQAAPTPAPVPDSLAAVREEYPEVTGPLVDELVELRATVLRLDQSNASAAEQARAREQLELSEFVAGQEQKLTEAHPDWSEVVISPEFVNWVQSGPQFIRDGIARNGNGIVDGEEAATIVQLFKSAQDQAAPNPLADKRQRQLEGSRAVPARTPGATPQGTPDDYHAEWKRLEAEDERRAQRSNATR